MQWPPTAGRDWCGEHEAVDDDLVIEEDGDAG
jgi:hypothetical protein